MENRQRHIDLPDEDVDIMRPPKGIMPKVSGIMLATTIVLAFTMSGGKKENTATASEPQEIPCAPPTPEPTPNKTEKPHNTINDFNLDDFNRWREVERDIRLRWKMQEGTVKITAQINGKNGRQGSGFLYSENIIVTAGHILRETKGGKRAYKLRTVEGYRPFKEKPHPYTVWHTNGRRKAPEIIFHPEEDLAILVFPYKIIEPEIALPIARKTPEATDPVIFCGSSVIAGDYRTEVGVFRKSRETRASTIAEAYEGESGGPAANKNGEVWGITRTRFGDDPTKRGSVLVTREMINGLLLTAKNPASKKISQKQ